MTEPTASTALPAAAHVPSAAAPLCEDNVTHVLFGFRLRGADLADPANTRAAASALRDRLLHRRWADALGQLRPDTAGRHAELAERRRQHEERLDQLGREPAQPSAEKALAKAQAEARDAINAEQACLRFASLQAAAKGTPAPMWKAVSREAARAAVHPDLMPVVDHLLHGGKPEGDQPADIYLGLPPVELELPKLLNQQRFAITLGKAAKSRLARAGITGAQAARLGLTVESLKLYFLASGIVMAALGLRFIDLAGGTQTLPHALLEEGLYALGHAPDRDHMLAAVQTRAVRSVHPPLAAGDRVLLDPALGHAARRATADDEAAAALPGATRMQPRELLHLLEPTAPDAAVGSGTGPSSTLLLLDDLGHLSHGQLIEALLGVEEGSDLVPVSTPEHGRMFTFCTTIFASDTPEPQLATLAYKASRRFGADYSIAADEVQRTVLRPFENICHAVATQGAAIALKTNGSSFLKDFCSNAVPVTYLPLAVLSYHEYLHLLHLTQECAFMPDVKHPERDTARLTRMRSSLAVFRLYFRFSHVSDLMHHNQVHRAWREALDLDRMLQEVALDVREAEQVLASIHLKTEELRKLREEEAKAKALHDQAVRAEYWKNWSAVGLALGGIAGFLHIVHPVLDVFHPPREWLSQLLKGHSLLFVEAERNQALASALHLYERAHLWEMILVGSAILLGVALGFAAHKAGSKMGAGH